MKKDAKKARKKIMDRDHMLITRQALGLSADDFVARLPEMLEHSDVQYKILNPEISKYEKLMEAYKKQLAQSGKLKGHARVDRLLAKLQN